jgi:predicted alpha/beta hydrolase family esterase
VLWSRRRWDLHVLAEVPTEAEWQSRLVQRWLAELGPQLNLAGPGIYALHHISACVLVIRHQVMRQDFAQTV